ncbi:MAG: hypothetical protein RLZZ297_1360 [Chloroflexota bacterium]|jgi:para-nitrobenzyl esterase
MTQATLSAAHTYVTVSGGTLAGTLDTQRGVRAFKGIPFAAPPVGALRWCAPQPPLAWEGVRDATRFGARAMQLPVFGDMDFRASGMSEDCLFLNVWSPRGAVGAPVLVYFYGGGNVAGDGSEPRYDGAALAAQGIVAVTVNYRLGVFGFLAHPAFAAPDGSVGNYGYHDQTAALRWIQAEIGQFGGDPRRVTIVGESAGSISVSVQMATPQAHGLFAQAMGSSGSVLGALSAQKKASAAAYATSFASRVGASSAAALRALPAETLLAATENCPPQDFVATIDGVYLPASPWQIYADGRQARVPLLVGWNSTEMPYLFLLGDQPPTVANYHAAVTQRFGAAAPALLAAYAAASDAEVITVATDLASDVFIGYSTWHWAQQHQQSSSQPVYRYLYAHPRPAMRPEMGNASAGFAGGVVAGEADAPPPPPLAVGAVHSADIEYFMGNLATNTVYAWDKTDHAVSAQMQQIYLAFVKTGNPNGPHIPVWQPLTGSGDEPELVIAAQTTSGSERHRARYLCIRAHGLVADV